MKRKGFTSGERMIATDHDCNIAKWSGREPGNFWCNTCGHKFAVDDGYRWIYANGNSPSAGNFMVCDQCDIGNEDLIKARQKALKLLDTVPDEYEAAMIVAYQLTLANKRIKQLEETLEPFAQQGRILDLNESGSVPDVWHFKLNGSISAITVGDCKKAYDILKKVVANKKETNIIDWVIENLGDNQGQLS